jgi:hypothetical protein
VHDPSVGLLTTTERATSRPLVVVPVTVTQSPAATDDAVSVAVFVKAVEAFQLTVTWPVCAFWTSIDEPEMAATEPEAPGKAPPRAEGPVAVAGREPVVVVVGAAAVLVLLPQAPRPTLPTRAMPIPRANPRG